MTRSAGIPGPPTHRTRLSRRHFEALPSRPVLAQRMFNVLEQRGVSGTAVLILLFVCGIGFIGLVHPGFASIVVLGVTLVEFARRMDQGIPLMQLTAFVATLQWLVGPSLSYYMGLEYSRYLMYVPDGDYFRLALPATALYCAALLFWGGTVRQQLLIQFTNRKNFFSVGVILVAISFVAEAVAERLGGGGLAFLLFLCSQLRYVGALYFLFSKARWRLLFAIASCAPLFLTPAKSGMFHDLILWVAMLSTYWIARRKWTVGQKAAIVLMGSLCVFMIQVVKQDYRSKLRAGVANSLSAEIIGAITEARFLDANVLSLAASRLNQGWIVSAVMKHVPEKEPFAQGETVKTAFMASIVPRLFAPNKKRAGGQENFKRFTGLSISRGTSMGISPLGEAYANYGVEGGIVFMGAFGAFFALLFRLTMRVVFRHPDIIFWIPLMFYQGIKAETELVVVINQLFKGGLVVLVGYYVLSQLLVPILTGAAHRPRLQSRTMQPNVPGP